MSDTNDKGRKLVWDLPLRVFHWGLAASFVGAYVLSESERLRNVHVMLGYTVAGLIAFRLAWGFIGTKYSRFSSFAFGPLAALRYLKGLATRSPSEHTGHNPAGSWAVYAIIGLASATCVTGYMNFQEMGGDALEELHEAFANAWLIVVGLHVVGVLASSIAHRENLARAMVTGYKRGTAGTSGSARPIVGLSLATAVLAFWTWTLATGGQVAVDASQAAGPVGTASGHDADEREDEDDEDPRG